MIRIQMNRRHLFAALSGVLLLAAVPAAAQDRFIVMASTTSTEQSGLFGHLLPAFTAKTGIQVRVVAQGTGQAIQTGARGDADVVFVHDRALELERVAAGDFVERRDVMYNDFVIVGPKADPAKIAGQKDVTAALKAIAAARASFVSRGDKSGTHAAELRLWKDAGIDIDTAKGPWYRETGSGMGPALNTASASDAYVLTDRGTWISFKNRGTLEILSEGDARLFNPYGVMMPNPARHPHVKREMAMAFIEWITGAEGQATIASYAIEGQPLFFPDARKSGS
jgi:tungstate transport system substrate-binding protein